ncbi:MAG TPA: prepilin-type N-terminal cleavage/methylation domain-containing protein [Solirubrobacterales bacterium]
MPMIRDERGFTLVEMLVGMMTAMVVLAAILMLVQLAVKSQDQTAERVAADQRGRPAMNKILDRLHATCVAPLMTPVKEGSDDNTLILLSKDGSEALMTPDRYVIGLTGTSLTESVYAPTGGEPPEWTFASTPSKTTQIVEGVGPAAIGEPPEVVPIFRYYAYEDADHDGVIETVPLKTPLSKTDASRTVRVDIAFSVRPAGGEGNAFDAVALTDSATLRIEPASEDSAQVNMPCV